MKGGQYRPDGCVPQQKVAVIVPFRDREPQLKGFLINVLPRLKRQNLDFTIYIIEQVGSLHVQYIHIHFSRRVTFFANCLLDYFNYSFSHALGF